RRSHYGLKAQGRGDSRGEGRGRDGTGTRNDPVRPATRLCAGCSPCHPFSRRRPAMSSHDRRSAGRRRAWGGGPIILKFDPLERRDVLSAVGHALPDLVSSSFVATSTADWNDPVSVSGQITNQGSAPVTQPFQVAIYASHNNKTGPYAVPLGSVTIPAGLAPGQSVPYAATVRLPSSPVPGVQTNGVLYLDTVIDPTNAIQESNQRNNQSIGLGYDEAKVAIKVAQPSNLVNTAVGVYPSDAQWGGPLA